MATTTLTVARRELARRLGYGEMVGKDGAFWTQTNTMLASTTFQSSELRDYGFDDIIAAAAGDEIFQLWWAYFLDAAQASTARRIKNYDASAGQLTVTGTNLSSQASGATFEIHKYSPFLLRECLNTAARKAFPFLAVPVRRYLFTAANQVRYELHADITGKPLSIWLENGYGYQHPNTILTDGGFEVWTDASTLKNWTATTLDLTREQATTTPKNYAVFRDSYSARCTSQTTSQGTLMQTISSPGTHSGQNINLSVWVYCLTAGQVSARIVLNGAETLGTYATEGLHRGTGWELLTLRVQSLITITTLTVGVSIVSTATDNTEFYVDDAICVVGPVQEPETYEQELLNWEFQPVMMGATQRNEVVFPYEFGDNRRLRFEGLGYLSTLSADADTIEIGPPETDLLYAYAAEELYERIWRHSSSQDRDYYGRMYGLAKSDRELLVRHSVLRHRSRLMIPDWSA